MTDDDVRQGLKKMSNWPTYPQLYINGELVGGLDVCLEMHEEGEGTGKKKRGRIRERKCEMLRERGSERVRERGSERVRERGSERVRERGSERVRERGSVESTNGTLHFGVSPYLESLRLSCS